MHHHPLEILNHYMSYKTKLAIVLVKIKYTSLTSSLQPTLPLAPN